MIKIKLKGVTGEFTKDKLETTEEGKFNYEIKYTSKNPKIPESLVNDAKEEFYGTFISSTELNLEEPYKLKTTEVRNLQKLSNLIR